MARRLKDVVNFRKFLRAVECNKFFITNYLCNGWVTRLCFEASTDTVTYLHMYGTGKLRQQPGQPRPEFGTKYGYRWRLPVFIYVQYSRELRLDLDF